MSWHAVAADLLQFAAVLLAYSIVGCKCNCVEASAANLRLMLCCQHFYLLFLITALAHTYDTPYLGKVETFAD